MSDHKVFDGSEPLMTFTIHTNFGPKPIGHLLFRDGKFSFQGDMDLSAQIFVDYVCDRLNNPKKYNQGS